MTHIQLLTDPGSNLLECSTRYPKEVRHEQYKRMSRARCLTWVHLLKSVIFLVSSNVIVVPGSGGAIIFEFVSCRHMVSPYKQRVSLERAVAHCLPKQNNSDPKVQQYPDQKGMPKLLHSRRHSVVHVVVRLL